MLYGDVRLLTRYVREAHGGVFRRVALSGLIDSADRPHKRTPKTQTTRIVRRVTVEDDPYRDSPSTLTEEGAEGSGEGGGGGGTKVGGRKGIFKKKATSTSITSVLKRTSSVSSILDEPAESSPSSTVRRRHHYHGHHGVSHHRRRTTKRVAKIGL
ncbi:hypothetical protein FHG87_025034 [Trinorchestia longiramus]|nr:hypothetical protein FHG87_025034 [Trinorchestia longiramus]